MGGGLIVGPILYLGFGLGFGFFFSACECFEGCGGVDVVCYVTYVIENTRISLTHW